MKRSKLVGFVLAFIFTLLITSRGLFVSNDIAINALEDQGYTNVEITNKHWFMFGLIGCADSDAAKFDVIATNPSGNKVELYVCSGWPFKGSTIRS